MKKLLTGLTAMLLLLAGCSASGNSESASEETMTVTVYQQDKADAILLSTEEGYVLIDTGLEENKDELVASLQEAGVSELYAMIITHFDKDHVGGADAVLENFTVSHVYTTYETKESDDISEFENALKEAGLNAIVISGDQSFTLGGAVFTMSGASDSYSSDESNNSSIITQVVFAGQTLLFMGDAQDERITEYMQSHDVKADFLKVPYHGNYMDISDEFYQAAGAEYAVVTNGSSEPSAKNIRKTTESLENAGTAVYLLSEGSVTAVVTKNGITVSQ